MNEINLSWPSKKLSPNGRHHWSEKARAVKKYRTEARYAVLEAGWNGIEITGLIQLNITYHPPSRRKYDRDGLQSRLKAAFDGIADALGVDDNRFVPRPNPIFGDVVKDGKVKIELTEYKEGGDK